MFTIRLLKQSELHCEPLAVLTDKEVLSSASHKKIAILSYYKNDFLKHKAHFCSKFKNKLKTMPALAAK